MGEDRTLANWPPDARLGPPAEQAAVGPAQWSAAAAATNTISLNAVRLDAAGPDTFYSTRTPRDIQSLAVVAEQPAMQTVVDFVRRQPEYPEVSRATRSTSTKSTLEMHKPHLDLLAQRLANSARWQRQLTATRQATIQH